MNEQLIENYLTGKITLEDLRGAMDNSIHKRQKIQSLNWENYEGKGELTITPDHLKIFLRQFEEGKLKAIHLQFIGTILKHSEYFQLSNNEKLNLIVYELQEMNVDTPTISQKKVEELNRLL